MKYLAVPLLALAVGACAPMDAGHPPASGLEPQALGLSDVPAAWPAAQWWRRYGDPQLDALVDEALAGNPSMTAAQSRLDQANAAVGNARAVLLPRVDANYSLTRQHYSGNYIYPPPLGGSVCTDNRLALDLGYEIDLWGKNRDRLEAALSRAQAAAADAQTARNLLAKAVVAAYVNLQDAFAQHEVLARTIAQREEVVGITRQRYGAGLDTQVEVKQAESALAAARVDLTRTETNIALLRNQLAALAGAGPQRTAGLRPAPLGSPATEPPAAIPLDLLGRRPDIVTARWRVQAAGSEIDAAKAEFYPNVNISAFAGLLSVSTGNLIDSGSRIAGIGPAVSLPLFDAGRLNANLAGRRAERDQAVADYNQAVLDAVQQVADALASIRMLGREAVEQRQAREAIDAAYDLAVQRYRAGLGNYLTVLVAQDSVLTQARLDTELAARAYRLDADLATALGGGYDPASSGAHAAAAAGAGARSTADAEQPAGPASAAADARR